MLLLPLLLAGLSRRVERRGVISTSTSDPRKTRTNPDKLDRRSRDAFPPVRFVRRMAAEPIHPENPKEPEEYESAVLVNAD
jgi:hypothetical protein